MLDIINDDLKESMKARDKEKTQALRLLKSSLIENSTSKSPQKEFDVVVSYCKKLTSSIETFPEGASQRSEILKELTYLKKYLPEQLAEDQVRTMIQEIISANSDANFGVIMKTLSPKIKGKFDGKAASNLVKTLLG